MSESQWILVYAASAGLVARVAKLAPSFPKSAVPWLALVAGYGLAFGMALYGGAEVADAALSAWCGLAGGAVAVGGHEALKPLLAKVVGDTAATKLLGKLPAAKAKAGGDK
jgi:hypothetical protein